MSDLKKKALDYHRLPRPGKLSVESSKPCATQQDLSLVHVGMAASVTPTGADRSYAGRVWQISPVIDPVSRQGSARIALAYSPELRPGGFASVAIKSGTMVASVLPESAILSDTQGSYVYIVGKDNKVERRAVKQGRITPQGIVIAEGLNGSERVVLRAGGFLQPGETIKPVSPKP